MISSTLPRAAIVRRPRQRKSLVAPSRQSLDPWRRVLSTPRKRMNRDHATARQQEMRNVFVTFLLQCNRNTCPARRSQGWEGQGRCGIVERTVTSERDPFAEKSRSSRQGT
ncbi:hypothetical protein RGR602_PC01795 (plasmid) [Rhizobium gallicum bv. gallicum R602sp]|uniref:Uncharacterized protein n=1 Tax=Rhizobium gallicum bv. gallicum R602sp TaxID=1041138 RepID=A0A0B4XCS9_9HYPH|nr:hypothetical protein RGR602_PC01795 [Rhizobium gallicum bv. gallicum R602sp]